MVMTTINDLHAENLKAVRRCFFAGGELSVSDIMKRTGLSHGASINAIRRLSENGEVILSSKTGNTVGRKTHLYKLNSTYMDMLQVLIIRKKDDVAIQASVCDLTGSQKDTVTHETSTENMSMMCSVIDEMMNRHKDIGIVLISTPGVCENGVISNITAHPIDVGSHIDEKWKIPYVMENDVNTACIGFSQEYPQYKDAAFIYQADMTKFGCGLVINGDLYRGFANAAGELRWFPFMRYTENRTAGGLLKEQILSVAALLNPPVIGYCSDAIKGDITFEDDFTDRLMPEIVRKDDLLSLQSAGLLTAGIQYLISHSGSKL